MRRLAAAGALAASLALPAAPARAEVAAILGGGAGAGFTGVLEMSDRDATPPRFWSRVRPGADERTLLNPDGDRYGDGPPSIVVNPVSGLPEAVWSYWDGAHYQIAWSRFDGTRWTMVATPLGPDYQFLTADQYQNLDPRLWIDQAGNRRVVWWRTGGAAADDVVVSVLPPGEVQWWLPYRVSLDGVPTRHPDIRVYSDFGGFIAAEEDDGGSLALVIFDCPPLDGHTPQRGSDPWGRTLVRSVGPSASLEPSLGAWPTAAETIPVVWWREGTLLATSLYDEEAEVWAAPVLTTYPVW